MVVPEFINYSQWLVEGISKFGFVLVAAIVLGVFFGYLVAAFRHGPFEAFYVVANVVSQSVPDFIFMSPRRVTAIAGLAIKEAIRRKVILVTFGIFAATLLFGGWFMNAGSEHPDQIYVNFVLWGTQLLVLLMGMLISAFSLPEDIKNKTIYTVVTKPVRSSEIVLGRIIGFGSLGTVLLCAMGLISFFFVWRGLSHDHQIVGEAQSIASFIEIPEDNRSGFTGKRVSENAIMEAETNFVSGHQHRLEIIEIIREASAPRPQVESNIIDEITLPDGRIKYLKVVCLPVGEHTHRVTVTGKGESAQISLGPSVGYFRARVPIYSEPIQFFDRDGLASERGLSVGKQWNYRGYVDGGDRQFGASLSKVEFVFDNFTPSRFSGDVDIVNLEMTLGVFRTFKGDVEKQVTGGLQFTSVPESESDHLFISNVIDFETKEYTLDTHRISRKIIGKELSADGSLIREGEFDLFDDFGANQRIKLILTCREGNQYIGVARADVYFRSGDQVYWLNFLKGYLGIWCQMVILISMGVAFSTFLSAPVTMLGSIVMIIVGFFSPFIQKMAEANHEGGGPIESFVRVVTQNNMLYDMDTGFMTTFIEQSDILIVKLLISLTYLTPNFSQLNFSEYLTYGYAIQGQQIMVAVTMTLAFCGGLTVLGYFALKTREIAK